MRLRTSKLHNTGAMRLSALDIRKLNAFYHCKGFRPNDCGSTETGEKGKIHSIKGCIWTIAVDIGYKIKLQILRNEVMKRLNHHKERY